LNFGRENDWDADPYRECLQQSLPVNEAEVCGSDFPVLPVSSVVKGLSALAHPAPAHLESLVHFIEEPDRDPALYPA